MVHDDSYPYGHPQSQRDRSGNALREIIIPVELYGLLGRRKEPNERNEMKTLQEIMQLADAYAEWEGASSTLMWTGTPGAPGRRESIEATRSKRQQARSELGAAIKELYVTIRLLDVHDSTGWGD